MRVIVSKSLNDIYTKYTLIKSLKQLRELQDIDLIIIHDFTEDDFNAGVFISEARSKGVDRFIYINSSPSSVVTMVMQGVDGRCFTDNFYLDDEEELDALVEECFGEETDEANTSLAVAALGTVQDFIKAFARGEERIKAPIYLDNVTQAINELAVVNKEQETTITTMGSSALAVFERASSIIHKIDENRRILEQKLQEVENQSMNQPSHAVFSNSIQYFAPISYMGNKTVLLVREYSPCRYLTSFMLGYLHHLHYELNKRVKLLFVVPKLSGIFAKYAEFTAITQESMGIKSLYDSEILVTNNPKKEVLDEIFKQNCDIFVIVDRLYGTSDIVTKRVTRICAASSFSDIARYKLDPAKTIFPVTKYPKSFITLSTIRNYPTEVDARYASYSSTFSEAYSSIDAKIITTNN